MKTTEPTIAPSRAEYEDVLPELFNPHDYIEPMESGFVLCYNPMAHGGLSAITVNTTLTGEALRNFENSIKRMVLAKLFSPKFGEVILTACRLGQAH